MKPYHITKLQIQTSPLVAIFFSTVINQPFLENTGGKYTAQNHLGAGLYSPTN